MPRLGILGTLVWDTIYARDVARTEPVEEWGGIAYALSAFEALRPPDWTMLPIVKVGSDLRERAGEYLRGLRSIDCLRGVVTVPEPNNRVTLRYRDNARRTEALKGGVPGWSPEELVPLVRSCDALYVNFIAGWEMSLEGARALRRAFTGPIYCDLHSIFLGIASDGLRKLRPLTCWREWLACFDFVQMNEAELGMLSGVGGDPWRLAAEVVGTETKALLITLAERGAAWVAAPAFERLNPAHPRLSTLENTAREMVGSTRATAATSGRIEVPSHVIGDPTGCGDVWGVTCFLQLLSGEALPSAIASANAAAARNAEFRGASHLAAFLGNEPSVLLDTRRAGASEVVETRGPPEPGGEDSHPVRGAW